jgi:hypothetical protein
MSDLLEYPLVSHTYFGSPYLCRWVVGLNFESISHDRGVSTNTSKVSAIGFRDLKSPVSERESCTRRSIGKASGSETVRQCHLSHLKELTPLLARCLHPSSGFDFT